MKYTQVGCTTSQTFTFVMLLQNNRFIDMFGNFCYKITHIGMQFLPLSFNKTLIQIVLLILQLQQGKSLRKRQSISCRLFHSLKPGRELPNVVAFLIFPQLAM